MEHPSPTGFAKGWIPASRDIGIPGEFPADDWVHPASSRAAMPLPPPTGEARHDAFTPERQVAFLGLLAHHGNVRAACAAIGLSPQAAYLRKRRDGAFAQGWEAALLLARESVEQVLADRALNGVTETIWYRGEVVGQRRRFDNRLLLAHLARLDRLHDAAAAGDAARAQGTAAYFDEFLGALLDGTADAAEHAARGWTPPVPSRAEVIAYYMAEAEEDFLAEPGWAADGPCDDEAGEGEPERDSARDPVRDDGPDDGAEHEEHDRHDRALGAARAQARQDAIAAWDADQADLIARLDALTPPAGYSAQDSVNFVNLDPPAVPLGAGPM